MNPLKHTAFNLFDNFESQINVDYSKEYTELQDYNQPSTSSVATATTQDMTSQANNSYISEFNNDAQEVIINFKFSLYLIF